jgi:WD40 repeat protein
MHKLLLLIVSIGLCAPNLPQVGEARDTWRRVAAFGRGGVLHVDTRNGYILVDAGDDAWLYSADTLEDRAHLDLKNARLSNDGVFIYGHRYAEPFDEAMNEYRPPLLNVVYAIETDQEMRLSPSSDALVIPSYDGSYLLGRDSAGTLLVWRAPNFTEPIQTPDTLSYIAGEITWSPAANRLALYDAQAGTLYVWTAGESEIDLTLNVGTILAYQWSTDGETLIIETETPTRLNLINATDGTERFHIDLEDCSDSQCLYYYAWRPNSEGLAVAVRPRIEAIDQLSVYAADGTPLHQLSFEKNPIGIPYEPFRYSRDGQLLIVDEQVYDAESFEISDRTFPRELAADQLPDEIATLHSSFIYAIFSTSADWMAAIDYGGDLWVWDTHTGEAHMLTHSATGFIWQTGSARMAVAVGELDSTGWRRTANHVELWDVADEILLDEISYTLPVTRLKWEHNQLTTLHDETPDEIDPSFMELHWDTAARNFVQNDTTAQCSTAPNWWSFRSEFLWVDQNLLQAERVCTDDTLSQCQLVVHVVCGPDAGDTLLEFEINQHNVSGLSWNPDGSRIATVDNRGYFVVRLDGVITSLPDMPLWSPDGSRMLLHTGLDWPNGMSVLDTQSGETLLSLPDVRGAEWSPGGRWIAAFQDGKGDRQYILDAETGEETLQIWGNPIFNGIEWGSDEVFLNYRSLFNELELNIWRLEGT